MALDFWTATGIVFAVGFVVAYAIDARREGSRVKLAAAVGLGILAFWLLIQPFGTWAVLRGLAEAIGGLAVYALLGHLAALTVILPVAAISLLLWAVYGRKT